MINVFAPHNGFEPYKDVKSILMYGNSKTEMNPTVSVLMPVYNNSNCFKIALESVLSQKCDFSFEVIVTDNNPYDGTYNDNYYVVESFGADNVLYYRNEKNIYGNGNFNRGIELARGKYITFCHDDDMLLPGALQRLLMLQKKIGEKGVFSAYNIIDQDGNYIRKQRKFLLLRRKTEVNITMFDLFMKSLGYTNGCLLEREKLIEIGGFDPSCVPSDDYALQILYTYRFGCVFNCIPVYNYRRAFNTSSNLYVKFAECDYAFRLCMIPYMKGGKRILNWIALINYRVSKRHFSKFWASGKNAPKVSCLERLIIFFINKSLALKSFSVSFCTP